MDKRPLTDNGDGTYTVPLTQGKTAVIDAEDADRVSQRNWYAVRSKAGVFYASTHLYRNHTVYLHRFVLGPCVDAIVDHVDGDGLNNRRSNLRLATAAQSNQNRRPRQNKSGFAGVKKHRRKWTASIRVDGKRVHLGMFHSAAEAAAAYAEAARHARGEFVRGT
jgi:hypothetical protein